MRTVNGRNRLQRAGLGMAARATGRLSDFSVWPNTSISMSDYNDSLPHNMPACPGSDTSGKAACAWQPTSIVKPSNRISGKIGWHTSARKHLGVDERCQTEQANGRRNRVFPITSSPRSPISEDAWRQGPH